MGALRLRRFVTADQIRLGFLLGRLKGGAANVSEEAELFELLTKARKVSDVNARTLAEMRGVNGNGATGKSKQKLP
jgi:hypothetical protein